MMGTDGISVADALALRNGNNGNGMFGDNGAWWVIILILFFAIGGRGYGGFGGSGDQGAAANYVLASDFATLQRQIDSGISSLERKGDSIANGLCDGFYAINTSFGNLNTSLCNQFGAVTNAITQNGYENRLATNAISAQLANCCCDIREGIQANTTQGVMNTNAIQNQIQSCCCENEKMQLQSRYDAAQMNTCVLTAIDKLGDRIIEYMNNDKTQALRDENQALRLAASQNAQTNTIIDRLLPVAKPAYLTCSPYASAYGYGYGNGCGCCGCA